eukprot:TRINITY_DN1068_c0_g1_i1.p1 TRINITY_DN1068_c0_g1~~TRINITY_DN1068_c0_g1_i1.p1  ORF type:complete len:472 (+),score=92.27 TRINITY_DN1068_c0_g1_i1:103-1518(+)
MGSDSDSDYSEGSNGGDMIGGAFQNCCCGILTFPLWLLLIGWNEKRYVCDHKSIIYAQEQAKDFGCKAPQKFESGAIAFFNCPINEKSLKQFQPGDFEVTGTLATAFTFPAVVAQQKAEMYQCKETADCKQKKDGSQKCSYTYSMAWSSVHIDSSTFSSKSKYIERRTQSCPGFTGSNPGWPTNVKENKNDFEWADAVKAGPYNLHKNLLKQGYTGTGITTSATPVNLANFASSFKTIDSLAGVASSTMTKENMAVSGTTLVSCKTDKIGCFRIQYMAASPKEVTAVTGVNEQGETSPIKIKSSWGCKAGTFEQLMAGKKTEAEFFQILSDSNSTTTWILRVLGATLTWLAVYCCLSPISKAAHVLGDCLDNIPCVGGFLEDALTGMVDTLVCLVSCGFGCSCALFVMAIVWIVMRPLYGGILIAICAVLFCLGFFVLQSNKGKGGGKNSRRRRKNLEEDDDNMEMGMMEG